MRLTRAFGIHNKSVVSFVGGGGKTTAMFALANELVAAGKRVVTTTTTRIFASQIALAPFHIVALDADQAIREVRAALREHRHLLVIGPPDARQPDKAPGVPPELIDQLIDLDEVDAVLNEADGSRMHPFKAPGPHEPVVPLSTTLHVPVVGVDVIGAPLDDVHVHRSELVAQLAGVPIGTIVDADLVAQVVTSPKGGFKNRPAAARVVPFVNKVENAEQLAAARSIARALLKSREIDAVVIGSAGNSKSPVSEVRPRVAAVVLAAGGSTRMQGQLKQLLPWGNSTLVRHTVETVHQAEIAETVVIVGQRADEVRRQVEGTGARIVENRAWAEGRSTSVRAGIDALEHTIGAAIFVNADQPFLTTEVIDTLITRHAQTLAPIVAPVYDGETGSPVLFSRELFDELRRLTGEGGGKGILRARRNEAELVEIADARAGIDVDTPEQYEEARKIRYSTGYYGD